MKVLGFEVDDALVAQWRGWYAPDVQPFFVDSTRGLPESLGGAFTPETRDTFRTWAPKHRDQKVVWYDEARARDAGLPFHRAEDAVAFVASDGIPTVADHPLAGFPSSSGPNCFGAVMAAAGVADAQNEWMQTKPFNEWLDARCRRGGRDDEPGTVLVWRETSTGDPCHAALALGDGLAFEKPSQCWWTPRYVTTVANVKRATRMRGIRLERWRIVTR